MEEFKQFDDTKLDERTKTVYEKRLAQYKKLEPFEEELVIFSSHVSGKSRGQF